MKIKIEPGQRYGKLTVVERVPAHGKDQHTFWLCRCDCGNTIEVSAGKLGRQTISCPECVLRDRSESYTEDLTGQRFGRLTAVRRTGEKSGTNTIWECRCDCGNTIETSAARLKNGNTQSCGCLNVETSREFVKICNAKNAVNYAGHTYIKYIEKHNPHRGNISGIKGVSWNKSSRTWEARIVFRGVHYYLGSSKNKDIAAEFRAEAEKHLHEPFLDWYYHEWLPHLKEKEKTTTTEETP